MKLRTPWWRGTESTPGQKGRGYVSQKRSRSSADLHQAQAAREVSKARRDQAERVLDFTQIRSPIDGEIARPLVAPGDQIKAGETVLARFVATNPMAVAFEVDERTLLRQADVAERQGPADPGGSGRRKGLPPQAGMVRLAGGSTRRPAPPASGDRPQPRPHHAPRDVRPGPDEHRPAPRSPPRSRGRRGHRRGPEVPLHDGRP